MPINLKEYLQNWNQNKKVNFSRYNIFAAMMALVRCTGIQNRLVFSFAALSLIPMLITGLFAYNKSSEAIKTKTSVYSVEVMNQVSANIQNELTKFESDSVDIAFSEPVQNTLAYYDNMNEWEKNDAEIRMQSMVAKKFSFQHSVSDILIYTNNKMKIIAFGNPIFKFRLKQDYLNDLFDKVTPRNGVPLWAIEDISKQEDSGNTGFMPERYGKAGILLARSFRSLDKGLQAGYLIMRMDESYISRIFKDINIGNGAEIFILDSEGTVVSSRNPKIEIARPYTNASLITKIKSYKKNEVFSFNGEISGKNNLIAYTYIPGADWYVVGTIPISYLNAESKRIGIYIAVSGIICFLFALLLSFIVSKSISKPLNKLVISMNSVKTGNFIVQINDNGQDEISVVASNFNNMVKEIKYLVDEVKNKENLKRVAELKTLQAQINPHFLSNTLNTVRWLANIQKAENISSLITSLIQLLQGCMGKGGELVSIKEEVDYIKNYLNIMAYRYYDKFKVHFEIEDGIMDFEILKFVLQPIVENSLIHGLEPIDGQGIIIVKGYRSGEELKITVTDNGVGISSDTLSNLIQEKPQNKKARLSGIGIWNVDERIKMYFGERYGISIESVPNLFTTVEITIPVIGKGGVNQDAESADSR